MSDTGGKRNTSEVLPCQANWALGLSTNAVPSCLTFSPPYFFTTVKATLTRACKDTVPALETQNLPPSLWGEKEIAVLRFLASSFLTEIEKPQLSTNPKPINQMMLEVAGQQGCVCGKKDRSPKRQSQEMLPTEQDYSFPEFQGSLWENWASQWPV